MNTLTMTLPGRARPRERGRKPILRPLHEWSARRTAFTAFALFACVFPLGLEGWLASGLNQRDAARTALAATQRKADDARTIVATLPELRARAAATSLAPATWTAADALHAVAALAAQSGLRVTEIEPQSAAKGRSRDSAQPATPPATQRALTFRAEGAFPEVRRFLEALAGLPRLIVPEAVQIKRQAGAVTVNATLRIHDTLPAVPLSEPARTNAFIVDPFGKDGATGLARDAGMLLVGTMVARHRAMALVQSAKNVEHYEPGQKIGDERLERVQPRAIQLASGEGASRTLTFAEDRK